MEDEKLKARIGANIASYRKMAGLTQAGLAEKLNYSDKAVSKWERGESIPDVLTLMHLAENLGITVNDLLADPNELPEGATRFQQAVEQVAERTLKRKANKRIILALSSLLCWFVALFFFVVLSSLCVPNSWLAFLVAFPANCIVALSLLSAWHDFRWNKLLISGIVWGSLACIHVSLLRLMHFNFWKIYLLGALGQLAIWLWFRMFLPVAAEEEKNEQEAAQE